MNQPFFEFLKNHIFLWQSVVFLLNGRSLIAGTVANSFKQCRRKAAYKNKNFRSFLDVEALEFFPKPFHPFLSCIKG